MTTREQSRHTILGAVRLRAVDGPDFGRIWSLDDLVGEARITGGRDQVHNVALNDEHVSASHFELRRSPLGLILRDLGSTNGIQCGSILLREGIVTVGQRFKVGGTVLEIEAIEDVEVEISGEEHFGVMYGQSPAMREVFSKLDRIASSPRMLRVLISGENGTGKELVARGLHTRSRRNSGPFVIFDTTTVPRELVRARLFGNERGAYTGAHRDRVGCLRAADGGVLFIDEIGELAMDIQASLLRVLQTGEVTPLGSERVEKIDTWVLAATHRDLRKMVTEGQFREDLYYRLKVLTVSLPPLRDRGQDVLLLARRFLDNEAAEWERPPLSLDDDASQRMLEARWPGNVRQLENVIAAAAHEVYSDDKQRSVIHAANLDIDVHDIPMSPRSYYRLPLRKAAMTFERDYLKRLLAAHKLLKEAAEEAGIHAETLRRLRHEHNLDVEGNTRPEHPDD